VRIASFNINGIKARCRGLLEWLEETRPRSPACRRSRPRTKASRPRTSPGSATGRSGTGRRASTASPSSPTGIEPVEAGRGLPGDPEDLQARYIEADVRRAGGQPVPAQRQPAPGPKFDYKIAWMERLRTRLGELLAQRDPTVVVGDFNVIPEDKDVWSVQAMAADALMQPASRDAYRRILNDGWTDALDTLNPRGGVWTFWDYQAGAWQRDHGFRIDHLLLSPECADRMFAAGVDKAYRGREKASDHTPVWVELA
jgi:exodeoxyribonuclease-3